MIKLITRAFVFDHIPTITSQIASLQKDYFDDDPNNFDPKDNRAWYYEMHDALDRKTEDIDCSLQVLKVDHPDKATYATTLSEKLIAMLTQLGTRSVVLIAHFKMPFVGHNTDPKNKICQRLIEKFIAITADRNYDEAFLIDAISRDLPDLIDFAFWMQRYGGGCPEFLYFADLEGRLAFSICQYGYVHLLDFKSGKDHELNKALEENFVKGNCDGYVC